MTIGSPCHHKAYGDGEVIAMTKEFFLIRFDRPPGMVSTQPGIARVVPIVWFRRTTDA